jgi:hypothetical protein
MSRTRTILVMLALILLTATMAEAHGREKAFGSRTIERAISLGTGKSLVIDNMWGDVTVTGTGGNEVRLVAEETIRARNEDRAERARREVSLRIIETVDGVVVCADGPFRDPDDCTEWAHERHRPEPGYRVFYDIELQVPRDLALQVRTIEGEINVSSIQGDFRVHGVNGGIEMSEIDGSGEAATVNGPVRVDFAGNPSEDCVFKTINGKIDVTFRSGLSADMRFETMNGDVSTDFEYELLPPGEVQRETRRGRTVWRLAPTTAIRVASGGPEFWFENINGNILIRRGR